MIRRRTASTWNALGRTNAFGAVLTREGRLAAWDAAEFFETGRADAARFVADMDRLVSSASRARALDFGCGVGRVTRALADHFDEVVGVDAAPSMIERARQLDVGNRCSFVLNETHDLAQFASGMFTVVYSRLVLQHIRPALVRRYIPELVRVLVPGGVLMFQLPEVVGVDPARGIGRLPLVGHLKRRVPWSAVVIWRRLKCRLSATSEAAQMTMFGMAQDEVLALVAGAGGRVLDVRADESHGDARIRGSEYWVTR